MSLFVRNALYARTGGPGYRAVASPCRPNLYVSSNIVRGIHDATCCQLGAAVLDAIPEAPTELRMPPLFERVTSADESQKILIQAPSRPAPTKPPAGKTLTRISTARAILPSGPTITVRPLDLPSGPSVVTPTPSQSLVVPGPQRLLPGASGPGATSSDPVKAEFGVPGLDKWMLPLALGLTAIFLYQDVTNPKRRRAGGRTSRTRSRRR